MEYNRIEVNNCIENETIYQYLKRNGFSENYVRNLRKKEGYIKLNNEIAFTNHIVKNKDVLELYKNPSTECNIIFNTSNLNIVYEDDDILVVNKPSGIPTIPSRSHPKDNLSSMIAYYMSHKSKDFIVRIVNRLDKDTSGLVCVAKHSLICNLLNSGNFIKKTYYAMCEGIISDSLLIDKPIITIKNELGINNKKREISPNGKPAKTFVKPIRVIGTKTLCKVTLEYGRTHQIRIHMSSIGHPLIGDEIYGKKSDLINHSALVCCEMEIFNPITKQNHEVIIDLPQDFNKLLEIN